MAKKKSATQSRRLTGVRLDPALVAALNDYKEARGVPLGTQVEFAIREWLERHNGVPDYTQQKLWEAVRHLVGTGSIRERCGDLAFGLSLLRVHGPAFPHHEELQREFDSVLQRLSELKQSDATESDLEALAHRVLHLYTEATALAANPVGASYVVQRRRG